MKALLFINGTPPKEFPPLDSYQMIACTDGAFSYLCKNGFPLEKLTFISGDFDSLDKTIIEKSMRDKNPSIEILYTPDQNKTDFEKALEILKSKEITKVDVFGGSGGEMDHFLGNLSVALSRKNKLELKFYDDFSTYFFIESPYFITGVLNKKISLYPFPTVENIVTKGLYWELKYESLAQNKRIGIRNFAANDQVEIQFEKGELLLFVER